MNLTPIGNDATISAFLILCLHTFLNEAISCLAGLYINVSPSWKQHLVCVSDVKTAAAKTKHITAHLTAMRPLCTHNDVFCSSKQGINWVIRKYFLARIFHLRAEVGQGKLFRRFGSLNSWSSLLRDILLYYDVESRQLRLTFAPWRKFKKFQAWILVGFVKCNIFK